MGAINLNGFFDMKKKEILDELTIDIAYRTVKVDLLNHESGDFDEINKREMELIQLKELRQKIGNIQEDI